MTKGTDVKITWNGVTMEVQQVEITDSGKPVDRPTRAQIASVMFKDSNPARMADVQDNIALFDDLTGDGFKFNLVEESFYEAGQKSER